MALTDLLYKQWKGDTDMQLSVFDDPEFDPSTTFVPGYELQPGDLHIGEALSFDSLADLVGKNVVLDDGNTIRVVHITWFAKDINPVYGCGNNPPDKKYGPIVNSYVYDDLNAKVVLPDYYSQVGLESRVGYEDNRKEWFISSELWTYGGRWDDFVQAGNHFYALDLSPDNS